MVKYEFLRLILNVPLSLVTIPPNNVIPSHETREACENDFLQSYKNDKISISPENFKDANILRLCNLNSLPISKYPYDQVSSKGLTRTCAAKYLYPHIDDDEIQNPIEFTEAKKGQNDLDPIMVECYCKTKQKSSVDSSEKVVETLKFFITKKWQSNKYYHFKRNEKGSYEIQSVYEFLPEDVSMFKAIGKITKLLDL